MRPLMKSLITLWVTLSVSMGSYGITGNDQYEYCNSEVASDLLVCAAYIRGFNEAHVIYGALTEEPEYCLPEESDYSQLLKVVTKYMDDYPEKLTNPLEGLSGDLYREPSPVENKNNQVGSDFR